MLRRPSFQTIHLASAALLAVLSVAGVVLASPGVRAPSTKSRSARVVAPSPRPLIRSASPPARAPVASAEPFASLAPIAIYNRNTELRGSLRLYREDASIDDEAASSFMRIATSAKDIPTEPLARRLVQLVFRAAYHFGGARVSIVSATRKNARGKHGSGEAIDFALEGVRASVLAAHLRDYPRAGVGIYTHPKTQFVHLDVRDDSAHWLDASPPGVTWREKLLPDPKHVARDASYIAAMDLPESFAASPRR